METSPDLAGYTEAQAHLRAKFGQVVPFFIPTETVWPDVPLDEEGMPIDPSVFPLASGFASASATCSVINRPIAGGARGVKPTTQDTAIGIKARHELVLVTGKDEFEAQNLDAAAELEVYGLRYTIRDTLPDQIGPGATQRMLIFVEKI
jgi:hypothetical protein